MADAIGINPVEHSGNSSFSNLLIIPETDFSFNITASDSYNSTYRYYYKFVTSHIRHLDTRPTLIWIFGKPTIQYTDLQSRVIDLSKVVDQTISISLGSVYHNTASENTTMTDIDLQITPENDLIYKMEQRTNRNPTFPYRASATTPPVIVGIM